MTQLKTDRTFVSVLRWYAMCGVGFSFVLWVLQCTAAYFFTASQMTSYGFNGELIEESARLTLLFPYLGIGFFGAVLFGIIFETCPFVEH